MVRALLIGRVRASEFEIVESNTKKVDQTFVTNPPLFLSSLLKDLMDKWLKKGIRSTELDLE